MIHFNMIDYQIVNLFRVSNIFNIAEKLTKMTPFDCVDEGDFFVDYEKGIVGGSLVG